MPLIRLTFLEQEIASCVRDKDFFDREEAVEQGTH